MSPEAALLDDSKNETSQVLVDAEAARPAAGLELSAAVGLTIERRRSVRRYTDQKLSEQQLELLLRAGINAPSGSNWQNQRFLVVTDSAELERIGGARFVWPYPNSDPDKMRQIHPGGLIGLAAAAILVFADSKSNDQRGMGEYYIWEHLEIQNCAASMQNILIQATAMGLASCWVSAADCMSHTRLMSERSWRSVLAGYLIPDYYKLQGIITLGYPKKIDELGFAIGESKHGATVWQATLRKPTDHYRIEKLETRMNHRGSASEPEHQMPKQPRIGLKFSRKLRLGLYSRLLRRLVRWCGMLDRKIHRIEIGKVLQNDPFESNPQKS